MENFQLSAERVLWNLLQFPPPPFCWYLMIDRYTTTKVRHFNSTIMSNATAQSFRQCFYVRIAYMWLPLDNLFFVLKMNPSNKNKSQPVVARCSVYMWNIFEECNRYICWFTLKTKDWRLKTENRKRINNWIKIELVSMLSLSVAVVSLMQSYISAENWLEIECVIRRQLRLLRRFGCCTPGSDSESFPLKFNAKIVQVVNLFYIFHDNIHSSRFTLCSNDDFVIVLRYITKQIVRKHFKKSKPQK